MKSLMVSGISGIKKYFKKGLLILGLSAIFLLPKTFGYTFEDAPTYCPKESFPIGKKCYSFKSKNLRVKKIYERRLNGVVDKGNTIIMHNVDNVEKSPFLILEKLHGNNGYIGLELAEDLTLKESKHNIPGNKACPFYFPGNGFVCFPVSSSGKFNEGGDYVGMKLTENGVKYISNIAGGTLMGGRYYSRGYENNLYVDYDGINKSIVFQNDENETDLEIRRKWMSGFSSKYEIAEKNNRYLRYAFNIVPYGENFKKMYLVKWDGKNDVADGGQYKLIFYGSQKEYSYGINEVEKLKKKIAEEVGFGKVAISRFRKESDSSGINASADGVFAQSVGVYKVSGSSFEYNIFKTDIESIYEYFKGLKVDDELDEGYSEMGIYRKEGKYYLWGYKTNPYNEFKIFELLGGMEEKEPNKAYQNTVDNNQSNNNANDNMKTSQEISKKIYDSLIKLPGDLYLNFSFESGKKNRCFKTNTKNSDEEQCMYSCGSELIKKCLVCLKSGVSDSVSKELIGGCKGIAGKEKEKINVNDGYYNANVGDGIGIYNIDTGFEGCVKAADFKLSDYFDFSGGFFEDLEGMFKGFWAIVENGFEKTTKFLKNGVVLIETVLNPRVLADRAEIVRLSDLRKLSVEQISNMAIDSYGTFDFAGMNLDFVSGTTRALCDEKGFVGNEKIKCLEIDNSSGINLKVKAFTVKGIAELFYWVDILIAIGLFAFIIVKLTNGRK